MSAGRTVILCPHAKSDDTPCAARDGHLAVYDQQTLGMNGRCVGCEQNVADMFKDVVRKYVDIIGRNTP